MIIVEKRRANYGASYKKNGTCEFCKKEVLDDQLVKHFKFKYWNVLACKYPYMDGNLMLIPKRHVTHTEKLSAKEWAEFPAVLSAVQEIYLKLFKTKSFNLMLQIGKESGATIPHIHWMIIPRPKKKMLSGWNVFQNFYFVTMDYKDLLKRIAKEFKI